jgi:hypothetical protein
MITHLLVPGLTQNTGLPTPFAAPANLGERQAQVLGHTVMAKLLGLSDARLVGGASLIFAPYLRRTSPSLRYALPRPDERSVR